MKFQYTLRMQNIDGALVGEIIQRLMAQSRISTRQRSNMWMLKVWSDQASIEFKRKSDRDDFLEVFEEKNSGFFASHGLVFVSYNTYPSMATCATKALMPDCAHQKK